MKFDAVDQSNAQCLIVQSSPPSLSGPALAARFLRRAIGALVAAAAALPYSIRTPVLHVPATPRLPVLGSLSTVLRAASAAAVPVHPQRQHVHDDPPRSDPTR
eukprot:CAMPEP_0170191014 /NCGR_PEP_ID=MMETSP0040_2-20121228/50682_1 /TAXON_ID=641309 /ORGANISM="Lotharella oceanica, Strain CCMP622" /LENGTH=102 /DNA_ID=CAMNT_0010439005 /DNA_START=15 /DNA_END=321 /DNA_ORIENTATION=-